MSPTWYDVLDLSPDASADEVRAAWKAAIADLEPGQRRFVVANQAAEVLLDPERRAAYDAELAAAEPATGPGTEPGDHQVETPPAGASAPVAPELPRADPESRPEPVANPSAAAPVSPAVPAADPAPTADSAPAVDSTPGADPAPTADPAPAGARGGRGVPTWVLLVVGLLTVAVLALTAWAWLGSESDSSLEAAARDAQAAAEQAIVPVLSYDVAQLDADREAAHAYLTDDFGEEYDRLFDGIVAQNAPETGTKVTWEVLASGLVRADADQARIFLLMDQRVTNKQQTEPALFRNHVTVTMERVGEEWLLDGLATTAEDD